jgi:hypothetical protein
VSQEQNLKRVCVCVSERVCVCVSEWCMRVQHPEGRPVRQTRVNLVAKSLYNPIPSLHAITKTKPHVQIFRQ